MNKTIIMGRLAKEPELRYTSNNKAVCNFTLAVNKRFERDKADFFPVVAWEKTGEFCGKYFEKGRQVVVVGRLQTRTWDDDNGQKHYVTDIVAEEAYFADSKKAGQAQTDNTEAEPGGFYPVDNNDELPF